MPPKTLVLGHQSPLPSGALMKEDKADMRSKKKPSSPDIFASIRELAWFLKEQPTTRDLEMDQKGESLLAIFQDNNFRESYPGLRDLKIGIIGAATRDISEGVASLKTKSFGICYREGKMEPFKSDFSSSDVLNVVFSINWRDRESTEVSQEDINAAIYHLAVVLSELIEKGK